jgi:glycerate kinase
MTDVMRGVPETILVAPDGFGGTLIAIEAAEAIARGLEDGGRDVDRCPLAGEDEPASPAAVLDALGFDARMRAARCVVTGAGRLDARSLVGTRVSEAATRARQAGVPCHVVCGVRELDAMGARVLDLERILQARTRDQLRAAGRRLAELI